MYSPSNELWTDTPLPASNGAARHSIADWIFSELWQRIVTRELEPGSRIQEERLAEMLEVSRTPLREALRQLHDAGMIVRHPNRTWRVAPLSAEDAAELTQIRELLEGLVAREACARVRFDPALLVGAEQIIAQMDALQGIHRGAATVVRLGNAFHGKLQEISGCRRVAEILSRTRLSLERYRYLVTDNQSRVRDIVEEHRSILLAVASGDPDHAERTMRAHICRAGDLYIAELAPLLEARDAAGQPSLAPNKRRARQQQT